jgi:hypothetical protein
VLSRREMVRRKDAQDENGGAEAAVESGEVLHGKTSGRGQGWSGCAMSLSLLSTMLFTLDFVRQWDTRRQPRLWPVP